MSQNLAKKPWLVLLIGVIVGVAIGICVFPYVARPVVPANHQLIMDSITIYKPWFNRYSQPKLVSVSQNWMLSAAWPFRANTTYTRSEWLFYVVSGSHSDLTAACKIWGPGDDGVTYGVGIASLDGSELDVTIMGAHYTIPAVTMPESGASKGTINLGHLLVGFQLP